MDDRNRKRKENPFKKIETIRLSRYLYLSISWSVCVCDSVPGAEKWRAKGGQGRGRWGGGEVKAFVSESKETKSFEGRTSARYFILWGWRGLISKGSIVFSRIAREPVNKSWIVRITIVMMVHPKIKTMRFACQQMTSNPFIDDFPDAILFST